MNIRIASIKKRIKQQTEHLDLLIAGQYSGECIHDAFRHLQAMYEYLAIAIAEEYPEATEEISEDDYCEECHERCHDKDYLNDRD